MQGISFTQNLRAWIVVALLAFPTLLMGQGVVITETSGASTPHASSILDVRSTDKGMLIPRLTTVQRQAIASPANGLLVYDTNENSFFYYDASKSGWVGVVNYNPQPAADEPIFVVRNSEGYIVFAVYEKGVRMYVEDDAKDNKGNKSGFAIGGLTGFKDNETEYFRVTPDSVRIFLREPTGKGNKGGFAIGGLTGFKADTVALMFVAHDSTRFYIDTETATGGGKGNKGGFAIGGLTGFKNLPEEYLRVTRDSTRVYVNTDATTKGNKGGFAIGGLTGLKGDTINFMFLTPDNYFIGHKAGMNTVPAPDPLEGGKFNSFIGYESGKTNIVGKFNTFMGYQTGMLNTGSDNTFIGYKAGMSHESLGGNVYIGSKAGMNATLGEKNVFIGESAGTNTTSGKNNIFLGLESGFSNLGGSFNVFMGIRAGKNNQVGESNIFIGNRSGFKNTEGTNNVFLGNQTGHENISGAYNTFLGFEAGFNNKDSSNTFIGYMTGKAHLNRGGNVYIGGNAGGNSTNGLHNVFIGESTGYSTTYGMKNVFIGYQSGYKNTGEEGNDTLGCYNVFLGYKSGYENTTGFFNTAIGPEALLVNTTGYNNLAIGYQVLQSNTLGHNNTAIGNQSLQNNTEGYQNIAIGLWALKDHESGFNNLALGNIAMQFNVDGQGNTALGSAALYGNTNGNYNVAVGEAALLGAQGSSNTAVGRNALALLASGDFNTAIGHNATPLNSNTYTNSTVIGNGAIMTASNQVKLGNGSIETFYCMGAYYSTNSSAPNMYVNSSGQIMRSTASVPTGSGAANALAVWSDANTLNSYSTLNWDNSNLRLGVGTTAPSYNISFNGNAARTIGAERRNLGMLDNGFNLTINAGGSRISTTDANGGNLILASGISTGTGSSIIYLQTVTAGVSGTTDRNPSTKMTILGNGNVGIGNTSPGYKLTVSGTAWCTAGAWASDIRKKKNIQTLRINSISIIKKLHPVTFEWNEVIDDGMMGSQIGFIAQELEQILPSIVLTDNDSEQTKSIKYSEFIPILVSGFQEQQAIIENQESEIDNLKSENADLKARLDRLERYMLSQEN